MKNFLAGFLVAFFLAVFFLIPAAQKNVVKSEPMQIFEVGDLKIGFLVDKDVDEEGRKEMEHLMEQFTLAAGNTLAGYQASGNLGHIQLLTQRILGNKDEEALLRARLMQTHGPTPRLSDKD